MQIRDLTDRQFYIIVAYQCVETFIYDIDKFLLFCLKRIQILIILKYMKIEGVFLSNGFLFDLTFAVIAFGAFLFGGDSVTAVVNAIPGWLTTGIGIAAGILPALGFAQLINMIMNKKVAVFFLLGFLLSAYMGISTVGIVCFSVVIVGILLIVKDFVPNQPALQGGMDDDNEF